MNDFNYTAPTSVAEAVKLLASQNGNAKLLAGGTDILVQLREGLRDAEVVVDVKQIPELMELRFEPQTGLTLGAGVPCYRIYQDEAITAAYPALADSTRIVGGWQIQSRASVGGNLCNSSPAADTIPPLLVHDVVCEIAGPAGDRKVPVREFCTAPGKNVLQSGEILVRFRFPAPQQRASSAYARFIPRYEMDIAVAGAASWLKLNDAGNLVEEARIALAAVAPTPVLAEEASQWLAGKPATKESFAQAGELAKKLARPIHDMRGTMEYRTNLVGVLTKRTLAAAAERARSLEK